MLPGLLGPSYLAGAPFPALVTSQETELIWDTVSSSLIWGQPGSRGWDSQAKAFQKACQWPVSLWEDRGSRPSKMNGESPWGVEGSGRPQAVGERVAGVLKGTGSVVGDREGLLHNVGSPLSLKGWGGLEEGRGVGRPGAQRPPASASGSRALGLQVSTVLGVPTTSPQENPKGQVIFVHLPVDSAVMGHLCWEYRGWGPCPQGADSCQR